MYTSQNKQKMNQGIPLVGQLSSISKAENKKFGKKQTKKKIKYGKFLFNFLAGVDERLLML